MAKDAVKAQDAEETKVEEFALNGDPAPEAEARKARKKVPMDVEDWKVVARNVLQARMILLGVASRLSESCTAQQVAPISSAIDRINLAMVRLDTVAYGQHKHAGSGLFSVPQQSEDS